MTRVRYGWLHALNALLLIALWGFTVLMYRHLPEQIPGHMGMSGVTRWEDRDSGMWFVLPILGSFHALLMYALSGLAAGTPETINVPHKERLLALSPEGRRHAMEPLRPFMFGMAAWLLVLTGVIQLHMYAAARAGADATGGGTTAMLGIIFVALLPLAGVWLVSRAMRRRMDAWEASAAGDATPDPDR